MTSPRTILTAWNLHAKKQFGQNFLSDPSTPEMIVRKSGLAQGDIVFEIGAGLGALTIPCARLANKVYAVERDNQLVPLLKNEILAAGLMDKVDIIHDDILKVDLSAIAAKHGQQLRVMGNLPYNISSQILIWLVKARKHVDKAVFMFQKELADRIAAPAGSKNYGRLSAVVQYCAAISSVAKIDASQFFPKPKVDSEVIDIVFFDKPEWPANNEEFLFAVIKAAFGQRRKNLKNSLGSNLAGMDSKSIMTALEQVDIDHHRRAETLSIREFVMLSNALLDLSS
ncbi:MAG: ribosomal RNA small subunit methyltransferase A [Proteobacteria bacterium]|nr:ribosomal RNA small subunit methyltransferase A [Pseudomonadota bacterium]